MDPRIINFLTRHRVGVLSVVLPDGTVHGATCHLAHRDTPLQIYFVTEPTSRKCLSLQNGQIANASVVVGTSEEEWVEMQMSGKVQILSVAFDLSVGKSTFENKFGGELKPEKAILSFIPEWYRYSEFKRDQPLVIENGK